LACPSPACLPTRLGSRLVGQEMRKPSPHRILETYDAGGRPVADFEGYANAQVNGKQSAPVSCVTTRVRTLFQNNAATSESIYEPTFFATAPSKFYRRSQSCGLPAPHSPHRTSAIRVVVVFTPNGRRAPPSLGALLYAMVKSRGGIAS